MHLNRLNIRRVASKAWQDPTPADPFAATIEMIGAHGKVELELSQDLSRRILAVVAEEVANAGRATAEAMVAEAITCVALPAPAAA
jgi:hypothetical protein